MALTRWKTIADSLQADIENGTFKVGAPLPTEERLATQWGVSRMTAHRALQELQRAGIVARRQGSGTVVTAHQAKVAGGVALLFPNWLNLLEIELLRGISAELGEGQQIFFCDTRGEPETEARYLRRMRKQAVGIICVPTCAPENTPLLRAMVADSFPLVCVDRVPSEVNADGVVTDNVGASAEALRRLVARGHQRITHFTHDLPQVSSVRDREVAFLEVAREVGQPDAASAVYRYPRDVASFEALVELVRADLTALMASAEPPTLIFCVNDWLLPALLEACFALDIRVLQDLEILSFNDAPLLLPSLRQRLHLIAQQPHRIGQLAATQLVRRLQGDKSASHIARVPAQIALSSNPRAGSLRPPEPQKFNASVK